MTLKEKYSQLIKMEALRLGFSSIGIAKAEFLESDAPKLENWLQKGYHGEMKYLENHFDKRLDPRKLVDGAKSVIVLTHNYFPSENLNSDSYKIARYAYGEDYHHVLKEKLIQLLFFIKDNIGEVKGRAFTDSAPILERVWANKAGIGWQGKNTLLLQKGKGSYFFLAELIIDLELAYDLPFKTDHCGSCTRCIDACPTQALLPNGVLNAQKCISYLTIELKNEIPSEFKGKWQDWIFGCDICQEVCPWNHFSLPHTEKAFQPKAELLQMSHHDWHEITHSVFDNLFEKSAVKRTKWEGLKRNIVFIK
jgi:epoxyqueuosine reductase